MPDLISARIVEAQLSLAETLVPILVGGTLAILLITVLCLWDLCWEVRRQHPRN